MIPPELPLEARIVRDLIEWLEEQGRMPMLVAARQAVLGDMPGVPAEAKQVVLSVASRAVRGLSFEPEGMSFSTGFGPVHSSLWIPYGAILQVGSASDGDFVGAIFRSEAEGPSRPAPPPEPEPRRRFRIVTDDES